MAENLIVPVEKPHHYLWRFLSLFGEECYRTWRQELLASVIASFAAFVITWANDTLAWSTLKTALLATAIALATFALWHLVRVPYLLTHPRETYGKLTGYFGVLIVLCLMAGTATLATIVVRHWKTTTSASTGVQHDLASAGNSGQSTASQEPKGSLPTPTKKVKPTSKATANVPSSATPAGSLVQNNSGGINIQQGTTAPNSPIIDSPITIGSVPKNISPKDMDSIVAYLTGAPTKAHVKVVADQFSGTSPLPDRFYDALKNSGWTMLDAGVDSIVGFSAPGKKFQGAVVIIKGEPLRPDQTFYPDSPSDPLNYIAAVLEHLHIARILRRDPNLAEGAIYIQFEGGFSD
jgi:hypothetical protein